MGRVLSIGDSLSDRERHLVDIVARLRLATHTQLAALIPADDSEATPESRAGGARRMLARLTDHRILCRLERRIGGVRAGSSGFVYYLGPIGQRLVAYWQGEGVVRGRVRPEPGERFIRHRLAVSELYVEARLLADAGELDLVTFDVEPDCWRTYTDRRGRGVTLKPDAFVRMGERELFLEVDMGTESRPVVAKKLRSYMSYFEAGATGHVVVLTPSPRRQERLSDVSSRFPSTMQRSFTVTTLDRALDALAGLV